VKKVANALFRYEEKLPFGEYSKHTKLNSNEKAKSFLKMTELCLPTQKFQNLKI